MRVNDGLLANAQVEIQMPIIVCKTWQPIQFFDFFSGQDGEAV